MKFSLILTTINRTDEIEKFIESLLIQEYSNYELIIVDQNDDDRLLNIVNYFKNKIELKYVKSLKGLSIGRNIGIKYASGEIIAFPDDDCWYDNNLLEKVYRFFYNNPKYDGLTGLPVDEFGRASIGRFDQSSGDVNQRNVWARGISYTIFVKINVINKVGTFDEKLGVGANTLWGSGEETDFLLNALKLGKKIYYEHKITVHHPNPTKTYNANVIKKAFNYGAGMGRVLKKHNYSIHYVLYILLKPFIGTLLSLLMGKIGKSKYHFSVFKGRLIGWMSNG
ncbi:glycosyltransferase family 2 protein [Terrilactibacillus laevilacticus]|uniref:Glycosyltransferase family 2 protein n=1 Tax=Terrilactibacillus laevilacticus TaxID=1380157 RepID=A0ABW5PLL0_9BACI|nr:glycosyltransferase [Terrilactibacillus laevilacticus]